MRHVSCILWITLLTACAADGAEREARSPEPDAQPYALRAPRALDHGPLWFGTRVQADITAAEPLHTFSFELAAPAQLSLSTQGSFDGPDVDTVLALYREGTRGTTTLIARNDDQADSIYAALSRKLTAGRYRVQVKGKARDTQGAFTLETHCSGQGCPPPAPIESCVFGQKIDDIGRTLRVSTIISLRAASELPDALARQQLVRSALHSPEGDADSPEALFARVDAGLVRWLRLWDDRSGRVFRAFEYRIDAASYGAIFIDGTLEVAAEIAGGALQHCTARIERCRFGETYRDLRANPAFALASASVVDASTADALTATDREQLVCAVQVAYEEAYDLESALASVDQSEVNRVELRELATGHPFVAYEYGAGDNSYGGVFAAGSVELVARINDGDLLSCTVLE